MTWEKPKIIHNKLTKWNWMVSYPENLTLGERVDIGAFVLVEAKNNVWIGDNVKIGGGTKIYSRNTIGKNEGAVIIQKDACIGANSVILPGCIVGHGAIIEALSRLKAFTHVGPNEYWAGNPAKMIKRL